MKSDMIIFDDGLQEKWIDYDIKFVCFDSEKWVGNGHLIPSGPLREKMNALKNYHGIFLKTVNEDSNLDYIFNKLENLELVINNLQSFPSNNVKVNTDEFLQDSSEVKSNTLSYTETENTLGTLNISKNTNDTSEEVVTNDQGVNLNEKEEVLSPEDQFQVAFDNIRDKKWQDAKTTFEQFIADNPDNQLSGSAHYWLGELYILEKNYREAALIFAEGFQKFPDSIKAAEMLFKLSQSLYQVEKTTEACKTMEKLIIDFPKNNIIPQTKKQIVEYNCLENNE
mgnify:CR=1 FL=1